MSSAASSSMGNMPPRHVKKMAEAALAEAIDGATRTNHRRVEEVEDERSDGEELTPPPPSQEAAAPPASEAAQPEIKQQVQGYTMTTAVYPPQPCERCVRSKKTCRGIAGARCEHCKSLHQKCSNSTGPPRGRHATAGNNQTTVQNGKAGSSSAPARPKRKANDKGKQVEEDEDEDQLDEDDEDEKSQSPRKKQKRVTNGPSNERRTRILKEIGEIEGAIKKLQTAFAKDMTKLQQSVASLAGQVREMDN